METILCTCPVCDDRFHAQLEPNYFGDEDVQPCSPECALAQYE